MEDRDKDKSVFRIPGSEDYILSLREIWAELSEPLTPSELEDRLRQHGSLKVTYPVRTFLCRVGLLAKSKAGHLSKPKGSFTDEAIVRVLDTKCRFISELLEETLVPKARKELLQVAEGLAAYEVTIRTNWLRSAGMLVKEGRKFRTTRKGLEFLQPTESRYALNTIFYGPPGTGKTHKTFRRCVDICDGKDDTRTDKQVLSRYQELVEEERVEFVTFHQSYGYEEFVEGLRPATNAKGHLYLKKRDGVLKRIAKQAQEDSTQRYVLVIDEINRANISKVLGELITLLEEDKREGEKKNGVSVTLPYSATLFTLPDNLYILGTMNTADRSIALIDTALRRRFSFEEFPPDKKLLGTVDGIDLQAILSTINDRLEYLIDRDHLIGHAWLMKVQTKAELDDVMRDKIIPLIAEYFYDDWQKVEAVLGAGFFDKTMLKRPPRLKDMDDERPSWKPVETFDKGAYDSLVSGRD